MHLSIFTPSKPIPQGSLRTGRQGQQYWANAATLRPYRAELAQALRDATPPDSAPVLHGVSVEVMFVFDRPKMHSTAKGELKDSAPMEKLTAPDLDKLCRAVLDAITDSKCIYADDSQVVRLTAQKLYAAPGLAQGTYLTIKL